MSTEEIKKKSDSGKKEQKKVVSKKADSKKKSKFKAKKKEKKVVINGKAFVNATFNNTIISITDKDGNVLSWSSAGKQGFRGSRKNTPYAAQMSAETAAKDAFDMGLRKVVAYVKGPGSGREAAIRALAMSGIEVSLIKDTTPIPHNGCRPPKRRRV